MKENCRKRPKIWKKNIAKKNGRKMDDKSSIKNEEICQK